MSNRQTAPERPAERRVGFFTDATVCIGCKACEVACKQWNQLGDDGFDWSGRSYDHTGQLGASTWRHVTFIEREKPLATQTTASGALSWIFHSDVCKHCQRAGCLENCPTGAIIRTEYDTVYVQPDVCNGCGYCIVGCPFGVIARDEEDGRAWKCTFCYDRLRGGLEPACAKACPTDSIQFGDLHVLAARARERLAELERRGLAEARLYGPDLDGVGGTNAFFLLVDEPSRYGLPPAPEVPARNQADGWRALALGAAAMGLMALGAVVSARGRR